MKVGGGGALIFSTDPKCLCTILYYTILYYTILYYTILYYTILYYTILYYTILYYTILYYTILYYTILYYTILYYTILYYTILYYTILQMWIQCTRHIDINTTMQMLQCKYEHKHRTPIPGSENKPVTTVCLYKTYTERQATWILFPV